MNITMIYAAAENGVIGNQGLIPWKVSGEQLLFQAMTYGAGVIVGRRTFEEMGSLPNRVTVVVTSQPRTQSLDVVYVPSLDEAISYLKGRGIENVFIAGGLGIYMEGYPLCSVVMKTTIHDEVKGDTSITLPLEKHFDRVFTKKFYSNVDFTFEIYQRKE